MHLPEVYAIHSFPALTNSIPRSTDIDAYDHLRGLLLPNVEHDRVKIIIGQDNSAALMPLEIRTCERGEPVVVRTPIGWAINGPMSAAGADKTDISNLISTEARLYDTDDDHTLSPPIRAKSVNDQLVLVVWDNSTDVVNGHYQLDIPFKKANPMLPNNKNVAHKG